MNLSDFVLANTRRGECKCGRCIDRGSSPDPTGHTADMVFFKVAALDNTTALKDQFVQLSHDHKGHYGDVNVFDGKEHNYMELGAWLGDQGVALQYMALGYLLGVFQLLTPRTMLGSLVPDDMVVQMAGMGYVSVQVPSKK